jgi:hypothetical protein
MAIFSGLAIAGVSAWAGAAPATQPTPATRPAAAAPDTSDTLDFTEPKSGAPGRLGGGLRGPATDTEVFILCSARVGRTISGKPAIYWYLTRDSSFDVDLVISRPGDISPFYRQRHTGDIARGLHEFSLDNAPSELQVGALYQITITLLSDSDDTSHSTYSVGMLERVPPPADLTAGDPTPADFARAGLWYDAAAALAHKISLEPANEHLRNQRLSLFRQQHVFLTFDPEKKWASVPGVAAARKRAEEKEKQLLQALHEDDQAPPKN